MINKDVKKLLPHKKSVYLLLIVAVAFLFASSFKKDENRNNTLASFRHPVEDSLLSKKAFMEVYNVLMSPRCMNCHPAGDVPLIGEDSQLHPQGVKRGKDGRGMYASKCVNCHGDTTQPGLHMAPGNPNWHLPPANMKMVFQGRTPRELAAQLLDTAANGNKTKADLIKHISEDGLVLVAWNPGEGRKLPPLSHEEFVKQFKLWVENGAYLPEK